MGIKYRHVTIEERCEMSSQAHTLVIPIPHACHLKPTRMSSRAITHVIQCTPMSSRAPLLSSRAPQLSSRAKPRDLRHPSHSHTRHPTRARDMPHDRLPLLPFPTTPAPQTIISRLRSGTSPSPRYPLQRLTGVGRYPGAGRGYPHLNGRSPNPSYRTPMRYPRWGKRGWAHLRLRIGSTQKRTPTVTPPWIPVSTGKTKQASAQLYPEELS